MYIAPLKTLLVEALKGTFDSVYPVQRFQDINIGLEYPVDPQGYPSLWVDYDDTQALVKAGISHVETEHPVTGVKVAPFTRWRFQGYVSITAVALTSLERDELFDEVVRVVAFANEDSTVGRFKDTIANNDLIAANLNTDRIEARGSAAAPGTPWGTDELMYERSLNLEIIGEFVPNPSTGTLLALSRIVVLPDMVLPGSPDDPFPEDSSGEGFYDWH
jgi:hypothetical protein